jgi:hypothetical protein
MAGGQRLISWLHPCSTSNVALNTRTCAHGPLMGHPNWAGCDNLEVFSGSPKRPRVLPSKVFKNARVVLKPELIWKCNCKIALHVE